MACCRVVAAECVPGYARYWLFLRFSCIRRAPMTRGAGPAQRPPAIASSRRLQIQIVSAIINCVVTPG